MTRVATRTEGKVSGDDFDALLMSQLFSDSWKSTADIAFCVGASIATTRRHLTALRERKLLRSRTLNKRNKMQHRYKVLEWQLTAWSQGEVRE